MSGNISHNPEEKISRLLSILFPDTQCWADFLICIQPFQHWKGREELEKKSLKPSAQDCKLRTVLQGPTLIRPIMNSLGMNDGDELFLRNSRHHCQRFSKSHNSNTQRAGFEHAHNLSSGFVKWSCAIIIIATTLFTKEEFSKQHEKDNRMYLIYKI